MNLSDFGDCFDRTHNGQPCNNRRCVITISRAELRELMAKVLAEGKKWEDSK